MIAILRLLAMLSVLRFSYEASTSKIWGSHPEFTSGTFEFTPSKLNQGSETVEVVMPKPLIEPFRALIGLVNFEYQFQAYKYNFSLFGTPKGQTTIIALFNYYIGTRIKSPIKLSYFAKGYNPQIPIYTIRFIWYVQSSPFPSNLDGYTSFGDVSSLTNGGLNMNHQNILIKFYRGTNYTSIDGCLGLYIDHRIYNAKLIQQKLRTNCKQITLYAIFSSYIIIDKTALEAEGLHYVQSGQLISYNGNPTPLTFTTSPYPKSIFMIGVKQFNISGVTKIQFSGTIGTTSSFTSPNMNYYSMNVSYFNFNTKICPEGYPYMKVTRDLCYDVCPEGYYLQGGTIQCKECNPSCLTCSAFLTCTSCFQGYYVALDNTCQPCSQAFSYCSSCTVQACTSCGSGFEVESSVCKPICGDGTKIVNLEQCDDSNTVDGDGCNRDCTFGNKNGCPKQSPYRHPINQQCIASCPQHYYPNIQDHKCLHCYYTCLTCTNGNECASCSDANNRVLTGNACVPKAGFFQSNNINALPCLSPCLTCTSATQCIDCVSDSYYLEDKICQVCSKKFQHCKTCTTSLCTFCLEGYILQEQVCKLACGDGTMLGNQECDDGNNQDGDGCNRDCTNGNKNNCPKQFPYRDLINNVCMMTCPDHFFNAPEFSCQACYYTCLTCINNVDCKTCSDANNRVLEGNACIPKPGFYDNNDINALPCIPPCKTCSSATQCLSCVSDSYYLKDQSCLICSSAFPNCATCTSSACITCNNYYQLVSQVCKPICGDNNKLDVEECDDGNKVDGDGCNSDCTIGNNNGCPKQTPYRNPINSQCVASCPDRFYLVPSQYKCLACYYTCLTCINNLECVSCSDANNRIIEGAKCIPKPGFYESQNIDASPCVSPCKTCTSATQCTSCVYGYYLKDNSCVSCSSTFPNCKNCTSSACSSCLDQYYIHPVTLKCHKQCQNISNLHNNFCPRGSFCNVSVCIPTLSVCPANTQVQAITCLAPRPKKLTCTLDTSTTPPGTKFCGVTASGARKNFDDECFACQDMTVMYYFLQSCQDAPAVCGKNEVCNAGTCQRKNA